IAMYLIIIFEGKSAHPEVTYHD
ncbi:MAG: hypothetical protein RL129_971, partial [Actinomycetota bacterium]